MLQPLPLCSDTKKAPVSAVAAHETEPEHTLHLQLHLQPSVVTEPEHTLHLHPQWGVGGWGEAGCGTGGLEFTDKSFSDTQT